MYYCNLFTQMNFNIGAMIGNGLANLVSQKFFGGGSLFGFGLPMFGLYQYPGINTYDTPPMYSNASLFTGPTNCGGYNLDNTALNTNFGSLSQSLSGGFNAGQLYSMDSFSYTTPVLNSNKITSNKSNLEISKFSSKASHAATRMVENAKYYVGKVNSDAEGNRLFSPNGKKQAWCADFVTWIAKKSYGDKLPSDFGSSSVQGLKDWSNSNNCYKALPNNDSDKGSFIAQNIKPGDIMIELRNGKSHTGIVTKVNNDGSFEVVEGNCTDSVKKCSYKADSKTLSGFISMGSFA